MADHFAYAGLVAEFPREVELEMVDDPFEQLALVGEVSHRGCCGCPVACAPWPAWVAHWLSVARTASRRRDVRVLRQALVRVPEYAALFDEAVGTLRSEVAFAEALRVLVHESLVHTRRSDLERAESEQATAAVRSKYASLLCLWAASRRSVCRVVVARPDGRVVACEVDDLLQA